MQEGTNRRRNKNEEKYTAVKSKREMNKSKKLSARRTSKESSLVGQDIR